MKARFAFALGSLAVFVVAARAEVEFAGYMRLPQGEARFVLTDPAAQKTSEWIAVGENFAGYRVTSFDVKSELLAVEKDGVARQLRLKSAAVGSPRDTASSTAATTASDGAARALEAATTAQINRLAEMQELMIKERNVRREAVGRLRETLPEGHPQLLAAAANFADFTQKLEGNEVALDLMKRDLLRIQIRHRGSGDGPEVVRLQDDLREVEGRLAKARAASPAAAKSNP